MGMNPLELMQLKGKFATFEKQHPRVVSFFEANGHEMKEGNVLEFKIKTAEGKEYMTNMRLSAEDVEILKALKNLIR